MVGGDRLKKSSIIALTPELAELLQHFREYSLNVKHIKEGTVASEVNHVRRFLEYAYIRNSQSFDKGFDGGGCPGICGGSACCAVRFFKGPYGYVDTKLFSVPGHFTGNRCIRPSFVCPFRPAVWKKSTFPTTIDIPYYLGSNRPGTGHPWCVSHPYMDRRHGHHRHRYRIRTCGTEPNPSWRWDCPFSWTSPWPTMRST